MTTTEQDIACPKCGGKMWDNRATKLNPKQPDYKCKDRGCDGVIWPPRNGAAPKAAASAPRTTAPMALGGPLPYEQETGAAPAAIADVSAGFAMYGRCLDFARMEVLRTGLDKLGGDVAGAIAAMAATLYIQANRK
jgi:hypothetical protein